MERLQVYGRPRPRSDWPRSDSRFKGGCGDGAIADLRGGRGVGAIAN